MTLTHNQVQGHALKWLLDRPWARCGGVEIAYAEGRLDAVAVSGMQQEHDLERLERERAYDRWAALPVAKRSRRKRGRRYPPPKVGEPTVGVIEAKATRSDLLQDLRAGKMHTYTELGTSCWLALTPEALLEDPKGGNLWGRCAERLGEGRGCIVPPPGWGVLLVQQNGHVQSLRKAMRLREATPAEVEGWTSRIARAVSWRMV